ncbi:MAG TPA: type II secretion system major pseudopilin GspG [Spirochaetota bacterium]|nr:type II secretion system major pseudopilin GspG [Spirochaetota bacterium]HNT10691.1 type II secretion system major pseudopilin GspG [Spirochaetota bacterium]HNV46904.1 type II secretion system major pseudopilin GspG [Spirochaetota bacterium]HPU89795.1 type II secretion system major pseudopilin GspG [Spirochaetota bacterium]
MRRIGTTLKKRLQAVGAALKSNGGFSFIEIMIVVVIIGILSVLVVPRFMGITDKAKVAAAKQQISSFGIALNQYYLDNGNYPTTEQGLTALVQKPGTEPLPQNYSEKGYLEKKQIPKDPWGRDFIYKSPGEHGNDYEIYCLGADGKEGGEGINAEIKSWE